MLSTSRWGFSTDVADTVLAARTSTGRRGLDYRVFWVIFPFDVRCGMISGGPRSAHAMRLQEKGGKRHEMPAHHKLEQFLDEYVVAAGIRDRDKTPLFRSAAGRTGVLTDRPMHRVDAYEMIRRARSRPVLRASSDVTYSGRPGSRPTSRAVP
jgi:hypothetical protein